MGKLFFAAVSFLVFCSESHSLKDSSIFINTNSAQSEERSNVPVTDSLTNQNVLRNPKLFPYFLIQFPNEPCASSSGGPGGVCVSSKECRQAGGTTVGVCAQGFGACCRYQRKCGKDGGDVIIRHNATDIKGSNQSASCRFVLPKMRNICQIRLDFTEFAFGKGLPSGECTSTKLEIRGGNTNKDLCGNLTGQHQYLNYGTAERFYINAAEADSEDDVYSIRVSYIRCDSSQSVPRHCSQYYTEPSGTIKSFNWPQQQLNNQEYTICVASPGNSDRGGRNGKFLSKPTQRIEWSVCDGESSNKIAAESNKFFITGKANDAPVTDPSNCNSDFIQVFGGNRQCGNSFQNETVTSEPYLLHVRFDGGEIGENAKSSSPPGVMTVSKPREGCESLNTRTTKCVGEASSSPLIKREGNNLKKNSIEDVAGVEDGGVCQCIRVPQNGRKMTKADIRNSGFCLSYKIIAEE